MKREQMKNTKQELEKFLLERIRYFYDYEPNPFTEMRMVNYINRGLNELHNLNVTDETEIIMYDEEGILKFEVAE